MQVKPIKVAILAMGGEGGGVLANWIVDLGEHNGYVAQTTSVPGVAQRTGATIYYVELFPMSFIKGDKMPVLALMPMPGDVDVVLASELMEAGRAVQRGLVTRDRTTLITSTHRVYSIAEKSAMGDGRVDSASLIEQTKASAKQYIHFDMAQVAEETGSVISAVLFGALSASKALPFTRQQFEETIERGGVGVKASLRAFNAALDVTIKDAVVPTDEENNIDIGMLAPKNKQLAILFKQVETDFPLLAHRNIVEGIRRLVDFQDIKYAELYIKRLIRIKQSANDNIELISETARYLALWMSFEDAIRVAELKTRDSRFSRVRDEVNLTDGQILIINEYMHPRVEELSEILPVPNLAKWFLNSNTLGHKILRKMTTKGRIVRTSSIRGFFLLNTLASFKRWRRKTLRYQVEQQRIDEWLQRIEHYAGSKAELALEVALSQRLVKGYGDTHARGLKNYGIMMGLLDSRPQQITANILAELREAALADEHGNKLKKLMQTHALI